MSGVKLHKISKTFILKNSEHTVLSDLSMDADAHDITVILGKSGCGKTTLLRMIGGLESIDCGTITFTEKKKTAFVFQEARLMPWLSVRGNIVFGLKKSEIVPEEIDRLIRTVGLSSFADAYPNQLSGGMQQRVALARALAYKPSFILMDEPFAALDHFTRHQMQQELIRIQEEQQCGMLFVTHSIDEALLLAQKIIVLEKGHVKNEYLIHEKRSERDLLNPSFIARKKDLIADLY
ncbi:MAG: ATP-binding cassette domain-containing protein [Lachnospiraceae bacterium]|nr:ATP-binding cassette domain-containing protein [Lachnospiraceae bacterium]